MKSLYKFFVSTVCLLSLVNVLSAEIFNKNLTATEKSSLDKGEVLIKNIGSYKNISLAEGNGAVADSLLSEIKTLSPKYLAEVIQIRPYEGNEDLPQKLEELLNNVPDYAGIPYWSVRHERYYDLYKSAKITSKVEENNKTTIKADLVMDPFGTVKEDIVITKSNDSILYIATNKNTLNYKDTIDCVKADKMKMCIYLFRNGDNWILYGAGGVNAPRIPFLNDRIETSFINRIKTFCNFVFTKI